MNEIKPLSSAVCFGSVKRSPDNKHSYLLLWVSNADIGISKTPKHNACFLEKLIREKARPLAFMLWPRRDSIEIIFVENKKGHISQFQYLSSGKRKREIHEVDFSTERSVITRKSLHDASVSPGRRYSKFEMHHKYPSMWSLAAEMFLSLNRHGQYTKGTEVSYGREHI